MSNIHCCGTPTNLLSYYDRSIFLTHITVQCGLGSSLPNGDPGSQGPSILFYYYLQHVAVRLLQNGREDGGPCREEFYGLGWYIALLPVFHLTTGLENRVNCGPWMEKRSTDRLELVISAQRALLVTKYLFALLSSHGKHLASPHWGGGWKQPSCHCVKLTVQALPVILSFLPGLK